MDDLNSENHELGEVEELNEHEDGEIEVDIGQGQLIDDEEEEEISISNIKKKIEGKHQYAEYYKNLF